MRYLYVSCLVFAFVALAALLSAANTAVADCANPTKPEGFILYNGDHKTVQFCDGTTWWDMKAASAAGGGGGGVGGNDATPDAFFFTDVNNAPLDTLLESDIVQITGINTGVLIFALNPVTGTPFEYRICGDSACSTVLLNWSLYHGVVYNNQFVQLRATSPNAEGGLLIARLHGLGFSAPVDWNIRTPLASCTSLGGYCWYLAQLGESCDQTCVERGGYDAATATFAGADNANCESVMDALNAPGSGFGGALAWNYNSGCFVMSTSRFRDTSTTTSSGAQASIRRACACNS